MLVGAHPLQAAPAGRSPSRSAPLRTSSHQSRCAHSSRRPRHKCSARCSGASAASWPAAWRRRCSPVTGPDRQLAVLELGDRARRTDGAMRIHREVIGRLQLARRTRQCACRVTHALQHFVADNFELRTYSKSWDSSGRPPQADQVALIAVRCPDGSPFVRGHDGQEIALAHRAARTRGSCGQSASFHASSVAPTAAGCTTRACSMPGSLKSCTKLNVPKILAGNVEARHGVADDCVVLAGPSAARPGRP